MTDAGRHDIGQVRGALVRALRNQLLGHATNIGSRVLMIPYVLSRLSHAEYGLWAWTQTVTGFFVLCELGFTLGTVHPLAHAVRDRDASRVGRIIAGSLSVPLAVIAAITVGILVEHRWIASAVAGEPSAQAVPVFLILTITQGVVLAGFPLLSLLAGLQRLDLLHALRTPQVLAQMVLTVVILECGGRVVALAWLNLAVAAFHTLGRLWFARRLFPELRLHWPRREDFSQLRTLGGPQMLLNLLGAAAFSFERAFLGFTTDLAAFAQYAVASRLVTIIWEVQQIPFQSVLQSTAALDAAGDRGGISRLYARSLRLVSIVVFGLVASVIVCGPFVVRGWLGEGFTLAGHYCQPLAVAVLFPSICGPPTGILAGRARLGSMSRLLIGWAVVCVVLDAAWLWITGIAGAGYALLAINVTGTIYFLHVFQQREQEPPQWGVLTRCLGALAPPALAGWAFAALAAPYVPADRVGAFALAAGSGAVLWVGYAVCLWSLGLLQVSDRRLLQEFFRIGRRGRPAAETDPAPA